MDITTTEVADYIVGGVMACDSSRFDKIIKRKVPLVLSVGALDMVNFGGVNTVPSQFFGRNIHVHNQQVCFLFCLLNVFYLSSYHFWPIVSHTFGLAPCQSISSSPCDTWLVLNRVGSSNEPYH